VAASIAVESSGGGFRRGGEPVVVSAPTCIEFRAGWRKGKRGGEGRAPGWRQCSRPWRWPEVGGGANSRPPLSAVEGREREKVGRWG
jgi:hypothetical protein